MKKIIFLLLLIPFMAFSQKIKTKKDKVLVDEKEIAILNDKVRDQYELSDLTGAKQFTVEYKTLMEGQTIINQWLVLTSADGSKKTEIPYDVLITSFSPTKVILHLLSAKYQLFDANGFNKQKIDEFFNTQRENIGEKATNAKIDLVKTRQEKKEKVSRYRPSVQKDGTVIFGGNTGTSIVGKITSTPYTTWGNNNFVSVYDLDNILVAKAKITDNANNDIEVELFNNNKFTYPSEKRFSTIDNSMFFAELVGELVYRDYTLGHQAKSYNKEILNEKIKLAKERSKNLYNVNGYAFDEKGVKYEGILTAQFEKLDINQTGDNQVVDAIDNYGKFVTVKYKNEKGNVRSKTLSAKDNIRFYVKNSDGSETCYQGMKVKGDAMKKFSNAMSLGFNNAYFYKTLYTEKDNSVLVDPIESDRFVIRLKDKSEGQMIDSRNNEKLTTELSEYLATCKNLAKEIKDGAFDLKIEENLINIVKEYNSCK